jgi:hypothetical protein
MLDGLTTKEEEKPGKKQFTDLLISGKKENKLTKKLL